MSEEVAQDSQVEDVSQAPMEQPEGSAPAQEAPQQVTPDYWGAFKQLPGFAGKDDREVASTLYQAMEREQAASRALQQYQQVMPVAQEYLKYRPEFEQWRKAQSQQQQQTEQVKKWWNPPEIKDSYKTWLTRDEHGREVIHENAPPEALAALI